MVSKFVVTFLFSALTIAVVLQSVATLELEAKSRQKRSSLMAQILYSELRQRINDEVGQQKRWSPYQAPMRRVASSSFIKKRKRRSTTPYKANLQRQAVIDELQEQVHSLSRRVAKRSLMALILKDALRQRLEEERKPESRHRDIVWGKPYYINSHQYTSSHPTRLARVLKGSNHKQRTNPHVVYIQESGEA